MEVIHSVEAVIATKNVDLAVVDHGNVPIARTWRCIVQGQNLGPLIRLEVKFEKVISAVRTIVATENVKIIIESDRSVQRSRARRMVLVILLVVHFVPATWLLKQMTLCSTNHGILSRRLLNLLRSTCASTTSGLIKLSCRLHF